MAVLAYQWKKYRLIKWTMTALRIWKWYYVKYALFAQYWRHSYHRSLPFDDICTCIIPHHPVSVNICWSPRVNAVFRTIGERMIQVCTHRFLHHSQHYSVAGRAGTTFNYIYSLALTPGFNGLRKDNYKTKWENLSCWIWCNLYLTVCFNVHVRCWSMRSVHILMCCGLTSADRH